MAFRLFNSARVTQFFNAVEADASTAMAEAWALRGLQERFPVNPSDDLDDASRQRLNEMLGNHVACLRQHVHSLQTRLRRRLAALASDAPTVASVAEATPPAKVRTVFRAVEQIRYLTDQLITGQSAASLAQLARALLTEFTRLDAVLSDSEKN